MSADPFSLDRLGDIVDPVAMGNQAGAPPAPPAAALVATFEASPTRPERRRRILLAVAVAVVWVGGVFAITSFRRDLLSVACVAPIVALSSVAALGAGLTLRRDTAGLSGFVRRIDHALWAIPAAYVAVIALVAALGTGSCATGYGGCFAISAAFALGAGLVAVVALRRSFTSAPLRRGAAAGALVGLTGSIAVHAHCPGDSLDHLLVAHGAVILVFAIAGAALGARGGRP